MEKLEQLNKMMEDIMNDSLRTMNDAVKKLTPEQRSKFESINQRLNRAVVSGNGKEIMNIKQEIIAIQKAYRNE